MSVAATAIEPSPACEPFLKWVGGKRKLLPALWPLLPAGVEHMRHVEPFLGGGAMFFARAPRRASLSDVNGDLIETYKAVRSTPHAVIRRLRELARDHDEAHYYAVRGAFNARSMEGGADRAAQFIYLNKTCFNGLFRVNRKGQFNVPVGRYSNPAIADAEAIVAASLALQHAALYHAPFDALTSMDICRRDFVYLDPPYAPVSSTSNFTSYSSDKFTAHDQARLAGVFRALDRRGAKLMLSNSDTPEIRDLYRGFQIDVVMAPRAVNSDASKRGAVPELVIRNYTNAPEAEQLKLGEP